MAIHAYTSFSYSYLNRARVLATTLRRQHPDWVIWAVITDKEPEGFVFALGDEAFDHMITVEELFGENTDQWLFGHDIVEACTAVKGRALQHIMSDPTAEKVIYLDPDIAIFNSLAPVIDLLDDNSIVLTPHQTTPETERLAIIDNEIASLHYGTYNLGFLAVRNDSEARKFASWWSERLDDWCHDRLDIGVFVDQKWCNLIPCFFDDVKTLRGPGYNVASWNLSKREISITGDGQILVNGHLLRMFHFTKLGPVGDTMTKRYAGDNVEVYEIWWWYRNEVKRFTDSKIPDGWWYYGTFDNGEAIQKRVRTLYRSRDDLRSAFPNPRASGSGTFVEWLTLYPHEFV